MPNRPPATAPTAPTPPDPAPASDHWPQAQVLVVDDEAGMLHFLRRTLEPRVGLVHTAGSAEEAAALLLRQRYDLVILDIALPGKSGLAWLRELRDSGNTCEVVLITAFADLDTAIEALRAGASDFLLKPFRLTQVLNAVKQGLERSSLRRENWVLRRALSQRTPPADGLVGSSLVIKALHEALARVATVDSTVLLSGESGTGKELAALALHRMGTQASGLFVPLNCATVSPALIESELFGQAASEGRKSTPSRDGLLVYAQGGTLFLDEVDELPLLAQAALLRVLETRRVRPVDSQQEIELSARIIAASNRRLRDEVDAGRFRADLYYRLQVVEINLPPLRSHKEDIPELVEHFIASLAPFLGVPPIEVGAEELRFLQAYDWPGNVRELRNLIERSLIVGALNVSALYQGLARAEKRERSEQQARMLNEAVAMPLVQSQPTQAAPPLDLQTLERRHILAVLDSVAGDKTRAAVLLGVSRRTLERRVAEWGLT